MDSVVVNNWTELTYNGRTYAVDNKFNLPSFDTGVRTRAFVIVSWDRDVLTLYLIKQERYSTEGLDSATEQSGRRLVIRNGIVEVETENGRYTLQGEKIF